MYTGISESIFKGHSLHPDSLRPDLNVQNNQYWISWLLLLCYAIYVWIKVKHDKNLGQLLRAFVSARAVNQFEREEYGNTNRVSLALSAIFLVVASLFVFRLNENYGWIKTVPYMEWVTYMKILGIVLTAYGIKILTIKLLGTIFEKEEDASEQVFNTFLFNKVLGLILFPVVVCSVFLNAIPSFYFSCIAGVLVVLVFLYKMARIMAGGTVGKQISKFYLFLYLCTLEILPLVVTIKLFISKI